MRVTAVVVTSIALAACGPSSAGVFDLQGAVYPGALEAGSIIALWTLRTEPAQFYKFGDGTSVQTQFGIAFESTPPPGAIDADGVGVATLIQLPDLSTVGDGIVKNPDALHVAGLSAEHAVIFKLADATGPAWSANFGFAYSCARCVRSQTGGLDTWAIAPCLEVSILPPGSEPCHWY